MGVVGAMLFVAAVLYVWTSLALARVFAKLGEDAWTAWVPVLNLIVLFRQGAQNPLWLLTFLVPGVSVVGTVFLILAEHRISQRFGRGVGTTVLAALLFPVWASILGFGSARPDGAGVNPTALPAPTPAPTSLRRLRARSRRRRPRRPRVTRFSRRPWWCRAALAHGSSRPIRARRSSSPARP
jgi:hypothetical protein